MSAPDVLAVMDEMAETIYPHASAEHEAWHRRVTEARAAVAELVEAMDAFENSVTQGAEREARQRMRAALARMGEGK